MGRQSRTKKARRDLQAFKGDPMPAVAPAHRQEPLRILESLHKDMQNLCGESGRRCWEYLLEMMALSSGWNTDTAESQHLWDKFAPDERWGQFFECWTREVDEAHASGGAFSEPIGQLLEEIEGTNSHLGQFFTPMSVVRMMNEISLRDSYVPPHPNGEASRQGLDPACGTGRFLLDALVHDDGIRMCGAELDLWLFRTAQVNARLLSKYTALRITSDAMKPFKDSTPEQEDGGLIMMGGRAVFMHADSLIVDLTHGPNWRYPLYEWTPPPWRSTFKINGYDGTMDDYEAGRLPEKDTSAEQVRFDYSMTDKPGPDE